MIHFLVMSVEIYTNLTNERVRIFLARHLEDKVRFGLDQHAKLDFYSASSMTQ